MPVRIVATPNEIPDPIPFAKDETHRDYDRAAVHTFWRMLVQIERVMLPFRARFIGKCSPIHLFWGAMDLAVTRFSGRRAPLHPGGIPNLPDRVTQEAYSHEVCSCGFWAGTPPVDYPAFYAYAYPEPPGFARSSGKWIAAIDGPLGSANGKTRRMPYGSPTPPRTGCPAPCGPATWAARIA